VRQSLFNQVDVEAIAKRRQDNKSGMPIEGEGGIGPFDCQQNRTNQSTPF